ncbi:DUF305 domain-containing protein [Glaciihabitans sp. INWT7]|uniref:DUF305 domain-containing protein n=1 Tax=Glaciihabitans sp. INWT7 TaxID=2596912 RepID=UPI0016275E68|nr:DUF305 domain-containing protein [Glaciihabitans sp. INWT7]QNE46216.1 DUF305 domain-containing protein [Glaciihabitans sp. INWT7]
MFNSRKFLVVAAIVGSAITLSACSTASNTGSTSASLSASAAFNKADVSFATDMAAHHQQAVEMSQMLLEKSNVDPRVVTLAKDIKAAQDPEIKQMKSWLSDWGQKTDSMAGMDMSGTLMSDTDMNDLKNSAGPAASKLFLTQMTVHHTSALVMAKTEVDSGKNADAVTLAKNIISTQTAEITKMSDLLASLG